MVPGTLLAISEERGFDDAHAARGLVALFPAELPMLQAVPAAPADAPAPTGFQLPVVQA